MTRVRAFSARRLWAAGLVACALALAWVGWSSAGAGADTYPSLDDIAAAKAAIDDQAATVAQLDAAIVQLEEAAQRAQDDAALAADVYTEAQDKADKAAEDAKRARDRADAAGEELDQARAELGAVAQSMYQNGGSLGSLEAILSADGFEDVVSRTQALDQASTRVDGIVQRVKATEVVSSSASSQADKAADDADRAAEAAATALAAALDQQRAADDAVAQAQASKDAALERLAQLQRSSVELERQRQEGLANERAQRDREAYEKALRDAQNAANGGNSGGSTGGNTGGSTGGSTGGNTGGSTGGNASNTGGTTNPPSNPPVTPPTTGSWRSTAEQGAAAAAWAQTQLGLPYLLGGSGPNAYDCSGLTSAAWKQQGISIPRSSRSQYFGVALVPLSDMRPGDLVFYGTDRDPNQIYHVAMYIGGGKVAEATTPGKLSQIRDFDASWRINNLIPYAGRP